MQEKAAIRAKAIPPVLRRFCAGVAAMTALSELYSWGMGRWFNERPPYGGSFDWSGAGTDFDLYHDQFRFMHTPQFWGPFANHYTYPAPLALVYWLLYKLPFGWHAYLALSMLALAAWAWYFARQLAENSRARVEAFVLLLLLLIAAWPVRMLLETGNMEAVVAVVLGVGVLAMMRGRWWLGAVLIGVAGSMKLYPLALLGLPLAQRRYREFAAGLAAAAATMLASLWVLGPSIVQAQRHLDSNMQVLKNLFVLSPVPAGLQMSHSLFNMVKLAVIVASRTLHPHTLLELRSVQELALMNVALNVYTPVVAMLGLALYWFAIRGMPPLNQVIALAVCAVLLPPISLDYTLVQLLVPFGLLCVFAMEAWRAGEQPRGLGICYACFALIFTTGAYFEVKYRFAAQVRTVALIVLLFAVLRHRFSLYDARQGEIV